MREVLSWRRERLGGVRFGALSLYLGLMAVGVSPRDPLNTLASVGGAAQGARV